MSNYKFYRSHNTPKANETQTQPISAVFVLSIIRLFYSINTLNNFLLIHSVRDDEKSNTIYPSYTYEIDKIKTSTMNIVLFALDGYVEDESIALNTEKKSNQLLRFV